MSTFDTRMCVFGMIIEVLAPDVGPEREEALRVRADLLKRRESHDKKPAKKTPRKYSNE